MQHAWIRPDLCQINPKVSIYTRFKIIPSILDTLRFIGGDKLVNRFREGCFGFFLSWIDTSNMVNRSFFPFITHQIESLYKMNYGLVLGD